MKVTISSRYGSIDSVHGSPHTGVDIAVPQSTPIHSIGTGSVHLVDYGNQNIGKGIIVHQNNGEEAIYGHLSSYNVHEGQYVTQGETIGLSGSTGHSTGPHLHLGIKENNHFIDPTVYADQAINGHSSWLQTFLQNGNVANNHYFNLWEWLGHEISQITFNGVTHFLSHFLVAFPSLAVISCGMYFFIGMVNKKLAKWGVIGVLGYGAFLILGTF